MNLATMRGPAAKNGDRTSTGEISMAEHHRRHEEYLDALPAVARCGLPGCERFAFSGTAAECREAARAHRAEAHPGIEKTRKADSEPAAVGPAADETPDEPIEEVEEVEADQDGAGGRELEEAAAVGDLAGSGSAGSHHREPERAAAPSSVALIAADDFAARQRRRKPYTPEEILAAFRLFHEQHGRWPLRSDIPDCAYLPHHNGLKRMRFVNWQGVWDELGAGPAPHGRAVVRYREGDPRAASWPVAAIVGSEPEAPAAEPAEAGELTASAPTPPRPHPVASPDPPTPNGEAGSLPALRESAVPPGLLPAGLDALTEIEKLAGWRDALAAEASRCERRAEGFRKVAEGLAILEEAV